MGLTGWLLIAQASWAATGWFEDYMVLDVNGTAGGHQKVYHSGHRKVYHPEAVGNL